jgi:RNA polymerase sigma factor (sigma-70 family)
VVAAMESNEEIVERIQHGENVQENMQQLYLQNQPLIAKFVRPYEAYCEHEDLMQEAYFALQEATEKYVFGEYKFISCLKIYIKKCVGKYVKSNGKLSGCQNIYSEISRYNKFISDYIKKHGEEPGDSDIRKGLDISGAKLKSIRKLYYEMNCMSIDEYASDDGEHSLTVGDLLVSEDDVEGDSVEKVAKEQDKTVLWHLVDGLPDQQKDVLIKRYKQNWTLDKLATAKKISKQRVNQIENAAFERLRKKKEVRLMALDYEIHNIYSTAYKGGVGRFKNSGSSATEKAAFKKMDAVANWMRLQMEWHEIEMQRQEIEIGGGGKFST